LSRRIRGATGVYWGCLRSRLRTRAEVTAYLSDGRVVEGELTRSRLVSIQPPGALIDYVRFAFL
jgi:hypothetical protein